MSGPTLSILHQIRNREIARGRPRPTSALARDVAESMVPDTTVADVVCPDVTIRKFICGGKFLVCFSKSLHDLVLYRFVGPHVARLESAAGEPIRFPSRFDRYFKHVYTVPLTKGFETLCRDFCLISPDQQFLILAATGPSTMSRPSSLAAVQVAPALAGILRPEDAVLYVVRIADGKVTDRLHIGDDFVNVAHHSGVSLYGDTLAVMRIRSQCVCLYRLTSTGQLVYTMQIGDSLPEDDARLVVEGMASSVPAPIGGASSSVAGARPVAVDAASAVGIGAPHGQTDESDDDMEHDGERPNQQRLVQMPPPPPPPSTPAVASVDTLALSSSPSAGAAPSATSGAGAVAAPPPIGALKHRLLAFLHGQAMASGTLAGRQQFFRNYAQLEGLLVWKAQLVSATSMLMRFASVDCAMSGWMGGALLALYDIPSQQFTRVFDAGSADVLQVLEDCMDDVRVSSGSSSSGLQHVLSRLPLNPQQLQESVLLDTALFRFDERAVSALDRPRPCPEAPLRFVSRRTGQVRFRIDPGPAPAVRASQRCKNTASYVFHPVQPFIISVQHNTGTVAFHFRA